MPFVTLTTNLSSEKVDKAFSEKFSEKLAETLGKPIEVSWIDFFFNHSKNGHICRAADTIKTTQLIIPPFTLSLQHRDIKTI